MEFFSGTLVPWPRGRAATGTVVHAAQPGLSPEQAACGLVFQDIAPDGKCLAQLFSTFHRHRQISDYRIKIRLEQGLESTVESKSGKSVAPKHRPLVQVADTYNPYQHTSMEPHFRTGMSISLWAAISDSLEVVHDMKEESVTETTREGHQQISGKADIKLIGSAS